MADINSRVRFFCGPVFAAVMLLSAGLFFSCGNTNLSKGHLLFDVHLQNYLYNDTLGLHVSLGGAESGGFYEEDYSFRSDGLHASGLFPNLDSGLWTMEMTLYDGAETLGTLPDIEVRISSGVTATADVTALYADGTLQFHIDTGTTDIQTTMKIEKSDAFVVAKTVREIDNYQWFGTYYCAWGNFDSLSTLAAEYPDGRVFSLDSRTVEGVFDCDVTASSITIRREGFEDNGNFELIIEDENGAALSSVDFIDFDPGSDSIPFITPGFPWENVNPGVDNPFTWTGATSPEVKDLAVIIYDINNPTTFQYIDVVDDPSAGAYTIPGFSLIAGNTYYLLAIALDYEVTIQQLESLDNYSWRTIEHEIAGSTVTNIQGIAFDALFLNVP